jgi:hypothetical protein
MINSMVGQLGGSPTQSRSAERGIITGRLDGQRKQDPLFATPRLRRKLKKSAIDGA